MSMLKRLFQIRPKLSKRSFDAIIEPTTPFYAIGDIHGCEHLLIQLLEKLLQDDQAQLVFVGDYVDRGEGSAQVIELLFEMTTHTHPQTVCLAGNHEDMMINFINSPKQHGSRWLRYGGLQTLASYGISGITATSSGDILQEARNELVEKMGDPILTWLQNLPKYWLNGNVAVVHAGADPDLPIESQQAHILKWGHEAFHKQSRTDGIWVVHGHNIVDEAKIESGRIAIDTGAYVTNQLTAVYIDSEIVRFIQS